MDFHQGIKKSNCFLKISMIHEINCNFKNLQGAELETAVGINVLIYLSILRLRSPNFMWAFSQPFWIRSYKKKLAQPQSGLSRGYQAKTVRNTLSPCHKCQKKKNFRCMFIQNFYTLTTVFMDSRYSFRPNLLDIEKKF